MSILIFLSSLLAVALAAGTVPAETQGTTFTISGVPNQYGIYPQGYVGTDPQNYGGQYRLESYYPDGTVAGQYGYQADGHDVQVSYNTGSHPTQTGTPTGTQSQTTTSTTKTKTTGTQTPKPGTTQTQASAQPGTTLGTTTTTYGTSGQPGYTFYKLPTGGIFPYQQQYFTYGQPGVQYSYSVTNQPAQGYNTDTFYPFGTRPVQSNPTYHFTNSYGYGQPTAGTPNSLGYNPFTVDNSNLYGNGQPSTGTANVYGTYPTYQTQSGGYGQGTHGTYSYPHVTHRYPYTTGHQYYGGYPSRNYPYTYPYGFNQYVRKQSTYNNIPPV